MDVTGCKPYTFQKTIEIIPFMISRYNIIFFNNIVNNFLITLYIITIYLIRNN